MFRPEEILFSLVHSTLDLLLLSSCWLAFYAAAAAALSQALGVWSIDVISWNFLCKLTDGIEIAIRTHRANKVV